MNKTFLAIALMGFTACHVTANDVVIKARKGGEKEAYNAYSPELYNEPVQVADNVQVYTLPENPAALANPESNKKHAVVTAAVESLESNPVIPASTSSKYSESKEGVTFQLTPGLLEPQVRELLLHHPNIEGKATGIIWKAEDNLQWPNEFTVSGKEIDEVLHKILRPYSLATYNYLNNVIIIDRKNNR
jgi:hypothetical protein